MIKKRFWETKNMFKRRLQLLAAAEQLPGKKLWRVTAIEMTRQGEGYRMGRIDHFTVDAQSEEFAIGMFKVKHGMEQWFVIGVEPETITA